MAVYLLCMWSSIPLLLLAALAGPPRPAQRPSEVPEIQAHLASVEAWLRAAEPGSLSPAQRAQRAEALDALRAYREAGRFPHNHEAPEGRARPVEVEHGFEAGQGDTPVFIDVHGVRCAVAELIHVSGHEALAREISQTWNLAYVDEIAHPGLPVWAEAHGFTLAELAAIQPAYAGGPRETSELPPWIAGVGAAELGAAAALTLNIIDSRTGDYSKGHVRLGYALGSLSLLGGGVLMWEARTGPHPAPASDGFPGYRYTSQTRYNLYGLGALGAVVGFSSVLASTQAWGELQRRGVALGPAGLSWTW